MNIPPATGGAYPTGDWSSNTPVRIPRQTPETPVASVVAAERLDGDAQGKAPSSDGINAERTAIPIQPRQTRPPRHPRSRAGGQFVQLEVRGDQQAPHRAGENSKNGTFHPSHTVFPSGRLADEAKLRKSCATKMWGIALRRSTFQDGKNLTVAQRTTNTTGAQRVVPSM